MFRYLVVGWMFRNIVIGSIDKDPIYLSGQISLLLIIISFEKPLPTYMGRHGGACPFT